MTKNPLAGVAMVLAAAALWGTTGTAQTFASADLSATWFGALRLLAASAFFMVYAAVSRAAASHGLARGQAMGPARMPVLALAGAGLCMAIYNLAFFAGIRGTGVAVGTAVALGSAPVWAGILQAGITQRIPPRLWWLGTAIAVTGGVLMSMSGGAAATQVRGVDLAGLGLCLLAGLSYACYALVNKRLAGTASPGMITLCAFSVAAALALPGAWLDAGAPRLQATDVWPVLYVGVVSAGIAYLLFSHALRHVSATTGVTLSLGEPVMAFILAVLVIGEQPTWATFAGMVLIVAGVVVVVRAELRGATDSIAGSAHPVRARGTF